MFLNAFLSYLMVFIVFVVVIVAAAFLGIFLRKRKSAKNEDITSEISGEE